MSSILLSTPQIASNRSASHLIDLEKVATIILSGGEGSRLFPLNQSRCKPAICYGGRHRLIDIPISNALNSGLKKIFVISQYLYHSLHQHVFKTYRSGLYSSSSIETLSPEARPSGRCWFEGTADAVRQNLDYLSDLNVEYYLILSGDQLYRMDMRNMLRFAIETDADAVVAALPVSEAEASRMGILQTNSHFSIQNFHEKPKIREELHKLRLSPEQLERLELGAAARLDSAQEYLGSMGIYLFKRNALLNLLKEDPREDFGKHLIPTMVSKGTISAFIHNGYWKDIGTVESFYETNMQLTADAPSFNLYDEQWPIFSSNQNLPGTRLHHTQLYRSIICEGGEIEAKEISHSLIGPRTVILPGTKIHASYLMGNDSFLSKQHGSKDKRYQIGANCVIQQAIIDQQVSIGSNVQLINKNKLSHYDGEGVYIRDGIILVAQGTSIPDGYIL